MGSYGVGAHLPLWSGNGKDDTREAPSRSNIYEPQGAPSSGLCMLVQYRQEGEAVMDVPLHCLIPICDGCVHTKTSPFMHSLAKQVSIAQLSLKWICTQTAMQSRL